MSLVQRLEKWWRSALNRTQPFDTRRTQDMPSRDALAFCKKAPEEVPFRFYATLSPETPLEALVRNGEIAPPGAHVQGLQEHGNWEPVSTLYFSTGATSYYSQSLEQWFEIAEDDLLEYLKDLRRLIEAPLPTGAGDLDVAIQRAHQIANLRGVRGQAKGQESGYPITSATIDCCDHFFQKQFSRVLAFTLKTLNVPSYRGLTIEHLVSLHAKGYDSIESILNAPDEVLLSIAGVGEKRIATIRSNLYQTNKSSPPESVGVLGTVANTVSAPSGSSANVLPLRVSFPSTEIIDPDQKKIFEFVKLELQASRRVEIADDIGYLDAYIYELLVHKPPEVVVEELYNIRALYSDDSKLSYKCLMWISDTFAKIGKYAEALDAFPSLGISNRSGIPTNKKLCLKIRLGHKIEPGEILTLFGPMVTEFIREEMTLVEESLSIILAEHEKYLNRPILQEWAAHARQDPHGYVIYDGTILGQQVSELPFYWFSHSEYVEKFCKEITRDAENAVREDRGIPNVGEGWISETQLYYEIKSAFPTEVVIQHASPDWLGRQHLDILLPRGQVALEFQGEQHDRPIAFFGGVKAFEKVVVRDRKKKELCEENGVNLVYVRKGYLLSDVVESVLVRWRRDSN